MNIDSHHHFWKYTADEYPWISTGMERLARDYLPADLIKATQPHDITGSVAVQARQTIQEAESFAQGAQPQENRSNPKTTTNASVMFNL